jgi:hypothetical protein
VIASLFRSVRSTGAACIAALALVAALFAGHGCYKAAKGDIPVPVRAAEREISGPEPSPTGGGAAPPDLFLPENAGIPPADPGGGTAEPALEENTAGVEGFPDEADTLPPEPASEAGGNGVPDAAEKETARESRPDQGPADTGPVGGLAPNGTRKGAALRTAPPVDRKPSGRPVTGGLTPAWAQGEEELVYRIRFLGITAGYARFAYIGRVSLDGRDTYHIHIRAWTTSLLSLVYPLNNTMDYYLDAETLVPVQREYLKREGKKLGYDLTTFDQEKGLIVTRDKATGEVRKVVSIVPNVHDPVTAVYQLRANGPWESDSCCTVYAGRKVWEISTKALGMERIESNGEKVETIIVQPVIRHDGEIADQGDLRLWITSDTRHVPVRIYAKIKYGTLVGELVTAGGGI